MTVQDRFHLIIYKIKVLHSSLVKIYINIEISKKTNKINNFKLLN